jgi:RHS repeat-associated protein
LARPTPTSTRATACVWKKTVSGKSEAFTWDRSHPLPLLQRDGATSYIYDPQGLPLEQVSSAGAALFYLHDQLGSTRLVSDSAGAVQASYTYDAYGNELGKTGTLTNPFGFAGQYTDFETGFVYLRARYYDPATAHFTSRDPMAQFTLEPYGYGHDNPLNGIDPTGLFPSLQQIWTATSTFVENLALQHSPVPLPIGPGGVTSGPENMQNAYSAGGNATAQQAESKIFSAMPPNSDAAISEAQGEPIAGRNRTNH